MDVVLLMIPISLLLSGGFVVAFIWAQKKGQFHYIDLEAYKILEENKPLSNQTKEDTQQCNNKQ